MHLGHRHGRTAAATRPRGTCPRATAGPGRRWARFATSKRMRDGVPVPEGLSGTGNEGERGEAKLREGYVVVRKAVYDKASSTSPTPVVEAVFELFPDLYETKRQAKNACRRKLVMLNGSVTKCIGKVQANDEVTIVSRLTTSANKGAHIPKHLKVAKLEVVFEDHHIACIVKPQGIGTFGDNYDNVNALLPSTLLPSGASIEESKGAMSRPRPCHRLDKLTGGILVVAKTSAAITKLSSDFEHREISKEYLAIAFGVPQDEGVFDKPLDGKEAVTRYKRGRTWKVAGSDLCVSSVHLYPKTGRRNQIRRHLAAAGHAIVGDVRWCPSELLEELGTDHGMFLWARQIRFNHPVTGEDMRIRKEPPEVFSSYPASLAAGES